MTSRARPTPRGTRAFGSLAAPRGDPPRATPPPLLPALHEELVQLGAALLYPLQSLSLQLDRHLLGVLADTHRRLRRRRRRGDVRGRGHLAPRDLSKRPNGESSQGRNIRDSRSVRIGEISRSERRFLSRRFSGSSNASLHITTTRTYVRSSSSSSTALVRFFFALSSILVFQEEESAEVAAGADGLVVDGL